MSDTSSSRRIALRVGEAARFLLEPGPHNRSNHIACILFEQFGFDLAKGRRHIEFAQHPEPGLAFEHEIVASVFQRFEFADPAKAADMEQRRPFVGPLRLDHPDPPVAGQCIAYHRAVARLEDVQRQLQSGVEDRAGQGKDGDPCQARSAEQQG